MRPTTSAATPPVPESPAAAGLSRPKSGATKRQRKAAAPLGDVTNLLSPPETPTPTKPRRTGRRPLSTPSAASSTCSSTASVTPAPRLSSAALEAEEEDRSVFGSPAISTVYARRQDTESQEGRRRRNPTASNGKGKAPVDSDAAGAASCPPLGKATRASSSSSSRKNSMARAIRPISSSAPCHKAKKKRPFSSTPKLPEDFVKKQRAYFADVDAFELPEEEVSESELE